MFTLSRGNLRVINEGFFIRFETWSDLEEGLVKEFGDAAPVVLGNIGRECGKRSCNRMLSAGKSEEDVLEELSSWKREENWGKLSYPKLNLEDKIGVVKIEDSFEARESRMRTGRCVFLEGYFSGFLFVLLKDEIEVVEEECQARGDESCVFRFEPIS